MTDLHVRVGGSSDLPRIETLVIGMFRDLGTTVIPDSWSDSLRAAFNARIGRDIAAFVAADESDQLIAVAIGIVDQRMPSPRRPTGRIGYVEWLATDPAHRRRGAARLVLAELLAWFDGQGIATVDVHASEAARPLYAGFGFATPAAIPLRRTR